MKSLVGPASPFIILVCSLKAGGAALSRPTATDLSGEVLRLFTRLTILRLNDRGRPRLTLPLCCHGVRAEQTRFLRRPERESQAQEPGAHEEHGGGTGTRAAAPDMNCLYANSLRSPGPLGPGFPRFGRFLP